MSTTPMRRQLNQAAPAVPTGNYCPEPDYLSTAPNANAIFDQLAPAECAYPAAASGGALDALGADWRHCCRYMDVAAHLVRACIDLI